MAVTKKVIYTGSVTAITSEGIGKCLVNRGNDGILHAYTNVAKIGRYMYSEDTGDTWSPSEVPTTSGSYYHMGASIPVDRNGRPSLFAIYNTGTIDYSTYSRSCAPPEAGSWTLIEPKQVAGMEKNQSTGLIIGMFDHGSQRLHAMWCDYVGGEYSIYHRYTDNEDGTWVTGDETPPGLLTTKWPRNYTRPIVDCHQFDMDIDMAGDVHAAWFEDNAGYPELFYNTWDSETQTWGTRSSIQGGFNAIDPGWVNIAVDNDFKVHVTASVNITGFGSGASPRYWTKESGGSWSTGEFLLTHPTAFTRSMGLVPRADGSIAFEYQYLVETAADLYIGSWITGELTQHYLNEDNCYGTGMVWNGSQPAAQAQTGFLASFISLTGTHTLNMVMSDDTTWGTPITVEEDLGLHVRRCDITIDEGEIDSGDRENFTVVLTEATLPLEMFSGQYAAQQGGGDIRFSSDEAGETLLPCDVRYFDTGEQVGNIAVRIPVVSQTVDTTFYIWYGKEGAEQPIKDHEFGAFNAYDDNFKAVWPLTEVGDVTRSFLCYHDRTRNGVRARPSDSGADVTEVPTTGEGIFVRAPVFDGTNDFIETDTLGFYAAVGADGPDFNFIQNTLEFTLEGFVKFSDRDPRQPIISSGSVSADNCFYFAWETHDSDYGDHALRMLVTRGTSGQYVIDGHSDNNSTIEDVNWHHIACIGVEAANDIKFYVDGVAKTTSYKAAYTSKASGASDNQTLIGSGHGSTWFNGSLQEIRVSTVNRDPGWLYATYSNIMTPGTFFSVGTPVTVYVAPGSNLRRSMCNLFSC